MSDDAQCPAEARYRPSKYDSNHTVKCQKREGHDGAHEYVKDNRTVTWYGPPRKQEDNTRFRYGFTP